MPLKSVGVCAVCEIYIGKNAIVLILYEAFLFLIFIGALSSVIGEKMIVIDLS